MNIIDAAALRLAAVVEFSDDAIISQALDGTIETWNSAAERLFGYTALEAVGRPIDLIVPPDRRAAEQQVIAQLRAGAGVTHFESLGLTKDGAIVPISLAISPVLTPDGQVIGLSRSARDIATQKGLEREAFRLAAIVNSSGDAIVSKDLRGVVQTWNPAAERLFGYTAAEIVGRPITLIIPPDRRFEEDRVLTQIRAGKSIEHFETLRQRKDGSFVEISLSVSPIKAPDGTVIGASKIARDISAQKTLERAAVQLAAIVDSSEDAIVSKDLNGIVQTWNQAAERMFGYPAAEMIGKPISIIIPAERRAEEDEVLGRIRTGRGIEHFETIRQRKDGSLVEISLSVSPIKAADGRVIGASKIARDITLQRQLTRAAEEANRVKDVFLAMLSHELRTPLNAVLGYTHMLRAGHFGTSEQERVIDIIERNANVLAQLVSDVLDMSAIVTGKVRLNLTCCDLADVVAAAADVTRPSADAKGVALRLEIPDGPVQARCDADRMQQVFWNLLSNAVKFTPQGGSIDVRVTTRAGAVEVIVRDTGSGIRPESLPFVFQRFWQAESRRIGQTAGLGLGLALALHFVELHGGTIAVASDGEGQGATFTVTLPVA